MKIITLFILLMISSIGFSQIKSTGFIVLNSNMTAKIDLNQSTSIVTLTITNPSTSWFGLGFNPIVGNAGDGMPATVDCVVMRSATNLSDSQTRAIGTGDPNIDTAQNWTILSNVDSGTTKTIVATRAFDTGDAADDMVSKQVAALSKGDAALINSTGVMSKELAKQKQLRANLPR